MVWERLARMKERVAQEQQEAWHQLRRLEVSEVDRGRFGEIASGRSWPGRREPRDSQKIKNWWIVDSWILGFAEGGMRDEG